MFFLHLLCCFSLAGVAQINGSAGPSSLNGIHTCKGELWLRLCLFSLLQTRLF